MNKFKNNSLVLLAVLLVLAIAFIWGNSLLPKGESAAQSGWVMERLKQMFDLPQNLSEAQLHHYVRKAAHFVEFALLGAILGGLFCAVYRRTGRFFFALPVLILLLVAVLDEYIQLFADRGSAVKDVLLDFSGGFTGLVLAAIPSVLKKKK